MNPTAPIVGTGIEQKVAVESYSALTSPVEGKGAYIDSGKISIKSSDLPDELTLSSGSNLVELPLKKYWRTNQNSSHNQRPLVKLGEKVNKGEVIAEGASCNKGELALGNNVRVAFMPWRGYNFEEAIVLSERLVSEDVFTSLHINEIDLEVRDTKRGEEELTAEIPNVSEDATRELDENGIIRVGAKVQEGDILIGKVSPKGETDPTPEEKLLKAIFGEKAGEVKDSSRRADPGVQGVVLNTKLFQKRARMSRIEIKKINSRNTN
jgi:DNA-directed RNA polymerase, beta subunit/140 kD subunit